MYINEKNYKNIDFVVGEKFYDIANSIFSSNSPENGNDDYNQLQNTFNIDNHKEYNIVYLHTMYKNQFFDYIRNMNKKFIIITHNSDINIDSVSNLPDNVIKWYSQNVNCKDDRLYSLPIGLENSRWFPNVKKQDLILNKLSENKNIKNLVYMNHNMATNIKERRSPYRLLQDKSFVTTEFGENGKNFENYIDNVYNHKFVICPMGNGIDTHRKWETLYLKTIPIEKRCINSSYYEDLPICLVESWEEITEEFLEREYSRITNSHWNLDKLHMWYWQNEICKL